MVIKFQSPDDVLRAVAARAKTRRLGANLSRRTLAVKSAVSEASIKRFETTGQVSFYSLIKLAYALDCMDEFELLFQEGDPDSIVALQSPPKKRGTL